jgi:hypothetical protein
MTRIFLTSNHLSSLFASIISLKISDESDKNYLLIDNAKKKEALVSLIKQCSGIGKWNGVIDASIMIEDNTDLKLTAKKKIIRKIKHWPVISNIYNLLLANHTKKFIEKERVELLQLFQKNLITECDEVFLLTQTALNDSLISLFPNAKISYYEHGIGDYLYFEKFQLKGDFYGFFADEYRSFLQKKGRDVQYCFGDFNSQDIEKAFQYFYPLIEKQLSSFKNQKCILFLMDALEAANPDDNFWGDYLYDGLKTIENINDYLVIIKPHPNQSNGAIEKTLAYLEDNKINYVLLNYPLFVSISVEIIFTYLKEDIHYFISTFSSALFYMSKYFPDSCKFILMFDYIKPLFYNGPKQYIGHYDGLSPLIREVFTSKSASIIKL